MTHTFFIFQLRQTCFPLCPWSIILCSTIYAYTTLIQWIWFFFENEPILSSVITHLLLRGGKRLAVIGQQGFIRSWERKCFRFSSNKVYETCLKSKLSLCSLHCSHSRQETVQIFGKWSDIRIGKLKDEKLPDWALYVHSSMQWTSFMPILHL